MGSAYTITRRRSLKRLKIVRARRSILDFAQYVSPEFMIGRPQRILWDELDAWIAADDPYNLIIVLPTRHGK